MNTSGIDKKYSAYNLVDIIMQNAIQIEAVPAFYAQGVSPDPKPLIPIINATPVAPPQEAQE